MIAAPYLLSLICRSTGIEPPVQTPQPGFQGLMGYIAMDLTPPPEGFGYGVSLYAAAWPLLEKPLKNFQIGLASTWIIPENRKINFSLLPTGTLARDTMPERGPTYRDVFQTIEGGLGFWASTQFGSTTAKFRMNGTPNGYNHEISSPGWGFGKTQALRKDQMGIAQISPYLLVPPDGLTFKRDTCGELLGYAWMALPLTESKEKTAGLDVTTGNQSWTMFLNTTNFRGPVAFYTPVTWSRISRLHPPAMGRGLDARSGDAVGGAIEVNTVPKFSSSDSSGRVFTKVPRLQFPTDAEGNSVLIHNMTHYSKDALFNQVEAWMNGGKEPDSRFSAKGTSLPNVISRPFVLRQGPNNMQIQGLENWVTTKALDQHTFGLSWKLSKVEPWQNGFNKASLPEYFAKGEKSVTAVTSDQVPKETGLLEAQFSEGSRSQPYVSPDDSASVWKSPGPAAGPFKATLTDGSVITYYWYRFIDQPSLQDADLSPREKERLQAIVVKMQKSWTPQKQYMAPPSRGRIASLDPSLIVRPPAKLGFGYVPIVTNQSMP